MILILSYVQKDKALLNKIKTSIMSRTSVQALRRAFPRIVRDSIDFVLDHPWTGRTEFADLDNVERTFIGLKVEHRLRHLLNCPRGKHDLVIDGMDVDVKNTIGSSWMIGPEIYRDEDPCILTKIDDENRLCSLGLIVARKAYLGAENRDRKRSILKSAFENILWLIPAVRYPQFGMA
jgi:Restriction endonuclease NaeI